MISLFEPSYTVRRPPTHPTRARASEQARSERKENVRHEAEYLR
jgi:hypothetical protein